MLLGVADSASIGGIGTLVGSPTNAIAAAQAGIGFTQWLAFGLPLVLVLLPLMAASGASRCPADAVVAQVQGVPAWLVVIAMVASCAFMLPVATPPNAIVFATEQVPQATMMRCGLLLNLVCIAVVAMLSMLVFKI